MLRSRMLPDGFKLFFGICCYAMFGAFVIGIGSLLRTTDGASVKDNLDKVGLMESLTGPLSAGWKGSIGNHVGYIVLLGTMIAAGFIAFLLVAFRDADPEAEAQVLQLDSVPLTKAPAGANYSPLFVAIAAGLMAFGWIKNINVLYAGVVLLVMTILLWTVRAWAERATGDDEVNAQIYHRLIDPLRVPVAALLIVLYIVAGISRVFLAAPSKDSSTAIFLVLGLALFLVVCAVGAAKDVPRNVVIALLVVFGIVILGFATYGLVKGSRPVEHEGVEQPAGEHEGGLAPTGVHVTGPAGVDVGATLTGTGA